MTNFIERYKHRFHFSVNFYSLFLIATFIPDVAGVDKGLIKYGFWLIKIILAIMVIRQDKRSLFRFTVTESLFLALVIIYTIRIFIDVFATQGIAIPKTEWTHTAGVIDFTGYCIGIIIAFSFRYDPAYQSEKSFDFFWKSLSISLVLAYFLSFPTLEMDVHNVRYDANSTINSIMYGQTGCALALISVYGIAKSPAKFKKFLFFLTLILGLISVAKAGSRSPVIVFGLVTIIYLITRLGKVKGVLLVTSFTFLVFLLIQPIMKFMESIGSTLTNRLTSMIVDKESSGRDVIYANTWKIIKEHPLFGSFYVIPKGPGAGGYPHNVILEVFMATGLVGGLLFIVLLFITISKALKIISYNSSASWIAILYLQIISYGMFSTGIYTSQDFWVLTFFFISMIITVHPVETVIRQRAPKMVYLKLQK